MAVKSSLTLCIVSLVLIVAAFFLGRLTASRPDSKDIQSVATEHRDSVSAAKLAIPPGQSVLGFFDMVHGEPALAAAKDGEVHLSGWAACVEADSPLARVQVLVDDKVEADATLSYTRPDVADAYGRPDFEKSGWKAAFPAHGIEVGTHSLKARVLCARGESGILPAFTLNIKDG